MRCRRLGWRKCRSHRYIKYLCFYNEFLILSLFCRLDFAKNCDLMWKQSCWSSVISAQLGTNHLNEGGLLQMTGAQAALNATPGKISTTSVVFFYVYILFF